MKGSFFKISLASVAVLSGAIATSMVACSDGGGTTDGGMDSMQQTDTMMNPDTSNPDTGMPDAGPMAKPKLMVLHASADQGPLRICFATTSGVTPLPALPWELTAPQMAAGLPFPGLYPGTGGAFPDTGTDVSTLGAITPYVINAAKITQYIKGSNPNKVCNQMIVPADAGADAGIGLVEGTDYFTLPTIPANTFQKNKTYILALAGCSKNANFGSPQLTLARCGANWMANGGNLEVKIFTVDANKPAMVNKMGGQYIQLSPVLNALSPAGVAGQLGLPDGSMIETINTTPATYPNLQPMTATALNIPTASYVVASTLVQADGGLGAVIALPITSVEQLTTGLPPDGGVMYSSNASFTFIGLGDLTRLPDGGASTLPDGAPALSVNRGYSYHIIGLPNDPVIPMLQ